MCGIAGIYGSDGPAIDGRQTLRGMLSRIRHRGPNEAGMFLSDRLCMGTVRLSIIDIASGQQPMGDEHERYYLCYNGEIYNYVELRQDLRALGYLFQTESDTEVLLHAWRKWGPNCLQRLNGAFAFALYDRQEDVLYLARDRYGKRPLFYAGCGAQMLFASEMKAFLAVDGFGFELDSQQLAAILTLWTPVADQSGFRGVRQVPQASYAVIRGSSVCIKRYYQLDFATPYAPRSEEEAVEETVRVLRQAVQIRLRSDVEVGAYLSGGLDSSILASILAEQTGGRLRTYSVAFDDAEFDESADQRRMAAHVDSRHATLQVSGAMIAEHFPQTVYHAEVPLFRTAPVPMYLLSKMVRDDGIKVVMTGEGADEAFLGYDLFKETLLRRAWNSIDDSERLRRLGQLYPYLKHYTGENCTDLLGLYQQFSAEHYFGLFSHELRIQNGLFSRRLLREQSGAFEAVQNLINQHDYFMRLSAIQRAQWLEYHSLLPGYLLSSQGDRMALAHSVENRCPFLDPRVIELAAAVNLKFDDGSDEKYLLRKAFAAKLPAANLRKRKYPYRAPDSKAFIASRPDYLDLVLSDVELRKNAVLNARFCKLLVEKVRSSPAQQISTKDNQAFVFLLSIALQHHQFVQRNVAVADGALLDDAMLRTIDKRSRAAVDAECFMPDAGHMHSARIGTQKQ